MKDLTADEKGVLRKIRIYIYSQDVSFMIYEL